MKIRVEHQLLISSLLNMPTLQYLMIVSYNGQAITWDHEGNEKTIHTTGRIIVDTESFNRFSPYYVRNVESFNQSDI